LTTPDEASKLNSAYGDFPYGFQTHNAEISAQFRGARFFALQKT